MNRREFTKVMGAVAAGVVAGASVSAQDKKAETKGDKHVCKGHNSCKGQGGCKSGDAGCAGKNSCKGKGGCAVPTKATSEKKDKSSCSGKPGCKSL